MLMRNLFRFASSLANKVNALIRKEESAHPGMQEVAAMVYVGDIYALIALGAEEENAVAPAGTPVDSVWPFIR